MPTRNVSLTKHFDSFVERSVRSGRYDNASEVMRDGLRLLEQLERSNALKLRALREAVEVGISAIDRGDYRTLDEDQIGSFMSAVHRRVRSKARNRPGG